jgi:hypothetical protein
MEQRQLPPFRYSELGQDFWRRQTTTGTFLAGPPSGTSEGLLSEKFQVP